MLQKIPMYCSEWVENISEFDKSYNKESEVGHFLKVDVQYPEKKYMTFIIIYHFYLKSLNLKQELNNGLDLKKAHHD